MKLLSSRPVSMGLRTLQAYMYIASYRLGLLVCVSVRPGLYVTSYRLGLLVWGCVRSRLVYVTILSGSYLPVYRNRYEQTAMSEY